MNTYVSNPDEAKEYLPRYKFLYGIIIGTFIIFTLRLWFLQIFSGAELREFSEKNRIKQNKILAPRGLILDREGRVLVENLPGFEAVLFPQYLKNLDQTTQALAPILGVEPDKLAARIQKSRKQNGPFAVIKLKDNLTREEVFRLKRIWLETPGLEIRESIVRHYPLGLNGAQMFGYVGEISKKQIEILNKTTKSSVPFVQGDIVGKSGIEELLEQKIRGIDGMNVIQVDAHGRELPFKAENLYSEQLKDQEPVHGHNSVLTIDRDLQEVGYKSMLDNKRIGALVAMQSNGEILAWVSTPSFDPNEFSVGITPQNLNKILSDPFKPLLNRVHREHNSPGSTFKPLIALAALQEKIITPTTLVSAPGVFMFGNRPYHDHLKQGHGNITVYDAIERSSNVFFYKMGIQLGVDKMYAYLSNLGIGQKTGIDLEDEVKGIMPNSQWKKERFGEEWQGGENLSTAIGQGFVVVTPLQMAVAYNTIGTEGKVVKPFIVKQVRDQDGNILLENSPKVLRNLLEKQENGVSISLDTFKVVKEGMRRVANGDRGTAKSWKVPGVQMAGKTGTAQVMGFSADQIYSKCENRPLHMRHHGWYIAFAPYDNPEITVAVLAEHSCHGSTGAAPIVRDVMEAYFRKHHPDWIARASKGKGENGSTKVETIEGE